MQLEPFEALMLCCQDMELVWILLLVWCVDNVRGNATSLSENQSLGSSFVVRAGYGVQENQNHQRNLSQSQTYYSKQPKIVKKDIPRVPGDIIYGSSSNNIHTTYVREDDGKPTLGDLQNLIKKLEDSKSTKIVRVLKVPAVYEIHMHSNSIGNDEYVHIPPEHFGNLKLNNNYMKKLQKTVHSTQNSYRNLRNVPAAIQNNVADKTNLKYQIPKQVDYKYNIPTTHPPVLKNTIDSNSENSEINYVHTNNPNQPQAIYEVPAPVLGKYPHPKPFGKVKFFPKNRKRSEKRKLPVNHQASASNLSPVYYIRNHNFPDLSLYYRTKEVLEKDNSSEYTKNNYVWDSRKIKSKSFDTGTNSTLENGFRETRKLYPKRRNYVKTSVYPAMRFIIYIKEKTFDGD